MQRVGALLLGLCVVFYAVGFTVGIRGTPIDTWTVEGVLSGLFGLLIVVLLLPFGIAHGLAACFPIILRRWSYSMDRVESLIERKLIRDLKQAYLIWGWGALFGFPFLLLVYEFGQRLQ